MKAALFFFALLVSCLLRALPPAVLNLTGQAEGSKPDILFLAPQLTEPLARYTVLKQVAAAGTSFPHAALKSETFSSFGALPILTAAGYRILPIRDIPWKKASEQLAEVLRYRRQTRVEDGIQQEPICAILSEDASAEVLAATLPALLDSDALLLLAPQTEEKGLTFVCWRNVAWPSHISSLHISPDNWIPTLAEIVGLPPPAECDEVSILPLLTGCGYQRPLERQPMPSNALPCTEVRLITELPKPCPWVPDYTQMMPAERAFISSFLPVDLARLPWLVRKRRNVVGLYVRTSITHAEWRFPEKVSCVIRVKGRPVFSTFDPSLSRWWAFDTPKAVPVELFLLLPRNFEFATLPFFIALQGSSGFRQCSDKE
ncbi:MAG: hypothetical protein RSB74_04125 [Kiritimatiellia bacterium]